VLAAFTCQTADILINAGVKGIINLSPVHLESKGIYVENLNIITAIQKAGYFMK
jgi:NADH/NAD ratio-sensing transcriptional regulator Rex